MASRKGGVRNRPHVARVRGVLREHGEQRPNRVEDLYGGGENGNLLASPWADDPVIIEWFQRRHRRSGKLISDDGYYARGKHRWKVPYGVREALGQPLVYNQIVVKYPFTVIWYKDGKRYRKFVGSIIAGIDLIATRVQYIDPEAFIHSRTVGYHAPVKLRGKFPIKRGAKTYYWCPQCMTARRFVRVRPQQDFYAMKKEWSEEKGRYEHRDRRIALLSCRHCGCTNRESKFRASNQPYEVRRIKKGVRRIKSRRK